MSINLNKQSHNGQSDEQDDSSSPSNDFAPQNAPDALAFRIAQSFAPQSFTGRTSATWTASVLPSSAQSFSSALVASGSVAGSTGASSSPATSAAASTPVSSTAAPSWISTLSTASIAADMAAADVNGAVTESGLTKVLTDLDATLTATKTSVTAAEFADLKTIAANLNNGVTTSAYLVNIMGALANGSTLNATWTGGAANSVGLGNLATGSSATQLSELVGKWFLGTDLPSSTVAMSGSSTFSVSYSASSKPLFAATGPSMSDVNQGYLGDCYFLSSCAEVANENSSDISSMFTNNGNGTYGVRFYVKGVAEYVTVNASLADGGSIFNSGSDIWASLAEKAYAQLQAGGVVETGNSYNYGNSFSTIGNGGMPADALEALTGASVLNEYSAYSGSWSDYTLNASLITTSSTSGEATSTLLKTIVADLSAHDDVVLASYTNATDSSGKTTLVADHAMSVYGYDSTSGMLEIRNPWGSETGQYWDTTFEVSLTTLAADGDLITTDNAGNAVTPAAPVLTTQTANQSWKLGAAINFTLPASTFADPQSQKLTYSAKLASGAALPSWLSFNATTGVFSGVVPNTTAGLSIIVTATDTSGLSASETFSVTTPASAPVLAQQTATQSWKLGAAVGFTLPSATFSDPQGEKLTYSATLSSGAALPSWLSFNATTGVFSGVVPNTAAGLSLKVTATDASGLTASETFSVTTPASAPTLAQQTVAQSWKLGAAVSFTLPSTTFSDPQGEKLTYAATLSNGAALPSWLSFNATTGVFSGVVPNTAAGLSLKVTATDASGLSASETFSVTTPASAPVLTTQTAAQSWIAGKSASFTLAANTFTDPQGEAFTLTVTQANGSALPSWLSFNATTRTFAGTPPAGASGLSLKVTAVDTSGLSACETIALLTPAPAAPKVTAQTAAQTWTEGKAVSLALSATTFTDPNSESMSLTATQANGSALPTWLSFNATTRTFSGTAPTTASTLSLAVKATDAGGASVTETFTASIAAAAASLTQAISSLAPGSGAATSNLAQLASSQQPTLASPAH